MSWDFDTWAHTLFSNAQLHDLRRVKRAIWVLATIARFAGRSLPKMKPNKPSDVERLYRHARCEGVSWKALAGSGCDQGVSHMVPDADDMLYIGDTTTLSFPHASVKGELGPLGGPNKATGQGFWVHSMLAVGANDGQVHALADQHYWVRPRRQRGKAKDRDNRPYKAKESYKWERSCRQLVKRMSETQKRRAIIVTDRESDVFEYLTYLHDEPLRHVTRASWNRCVADEEAGHLFDQVNAEPVRATCTLDIAQKGGRPARRATLDLRACSVTLECPKSRKDPMAPLVVNVVHLDESTCSPDNKTKPACWTLLTSEPIDTLEQILTVVRYYALRWMVEEFHKCWKSDGTKVEDLRLQSEDNLLRIVVPMAFAAVRIMQLRCSVMGEDFRRKMPQLHDVAVPEPPPVDTLPCTDVLSDLELEVLWRATKKRTIFPATPPTRRWALHAIAKLAGWHDSKRTGRPGYKTLWEGWHKLQTFIEGYQLAMNVREPLKQ